MKTRIILSILLGAVFFTGCKNESSKENQSKTEQFIDETYRVTLDVTVKKNHDFQIYYTDKTSADFNEKESLWIKVKGSELPQKIVFVIPKDILPTLFRLDFGLNNQQEDITLHSVRVDYLGKKFVVSGKEIANFFRPIEDTKINFETGVISPIIKDGKGIEPVLYPQEIPLEKELKKLIF